MFETKVLKSGQGSISTKEQLASTVGEGLSLKNKCLPSWLIFDNAGSEIFKKITVANSMNTVSLAAERFESEFKRGESYINARRTALDAALIPQINSLFAVGLDALPGMMTGQILSGVDPHIAVRYQIMVMWMIFGSEGLAAAMYLVLRVRMTKQSENLQRSR